MLKKACGLNQELTVWRAINCSNYTMGTKAARSFQYPLFFGCLVILALTTIYQLNSNLSFSQKPTIVAIPPQVDTTPLLPTNLINDQYRGFERKYRQVLPLVIPNLNDDISIVTHVSMNKLDRIFPLINQWRGPISIAVFISNNSSIASFHDRIGSMLKLNSNLQQHVVWSLLFPSKVKDTQYPMNILRNMALDAALTDFVFPIDVDFVPSPDCRANFLRLRKTLGSKMKGKNAYIVPAFERHVKKNEKVSYLSLPKTKQTLQESLSTHLIEPFHVAYFFPGHGPTNFKRWFMSNSSYRIHWQPRFEPYVMGDRKNFPKYWNGFFGYGYNKLSWIMEMHVMQFNFFVVPDSFLIHINHPGRENRSPNLAMTNEYFKVFKPYLQNKYKLNKIEDADWT